MPHVKTLDCVQLEVEIRRHDSVKDYLTSITDEFEKQKKLGTKLDPKAVLNIYISAVSKCAVSLIRMGVLEKDKVTTENIINVAFDLSKHALK